MNSCDWAQHKVENPIMMPDLYDLYPNHLKMCMILPVVLREEGEALTLKK